MKALWHPIFSKKRCQRAMEEPQHHHVFFRKTWHQYPNDILFDGPMPMPMTSTSWHDNGRNSSILWSGTQNDRNDRNSVLKLEQFERIVWTCLNFVRLRPDLHLKEVTLCLQKPEINVHGYWQAMLYDFHKHENQENIHRGVCLQCSRHVQCTYGTRNHSSKYEAFGDCVSFRPRKPSKWQKFMDSLNLEKRVDFEQGDIGLAGGLTLPWNADMHSMKTLFNWLSIKSTYILITSNLNHWSCWIMIFDIESVVSQRFNILSGHLKDTNIS